MKISNLSIVLFLFFIGQTFSLNAQATYSESIFKLDPEIDTLQQRLIRNPNDSGLHKALIRAYINNQFPALAFLEYQDFKQNYSSNDVIEMGAEVNFALESFDYAEDLYKQSYIFYPTDSILSRLLIITKIKGDDSLFIDLLNQTKPNKMMIANQLSSIYKSNYLVGNQIISSTVLDILRTHFSDAYGQLFSIPQILINTPEKVSYSLQTSLTTIFKVKHAIPVREVRIDSVSIFSQETDNMVFESEFDRTFQHQIQIPNGKNIFKIEAEDIYGFTSTDSLVLYGLNFDRSKSAIQVEDSLKFYLAKLANFIPDSVLRSTKQQQTQAITVSNTSFGEDAQYLLSTLLQDRYTGPMSTGQIKYLGSGSQTIYNFDLLVSDWMLKNTNIQTTNLILLSGQFIIKNDSLFYPLADNLLDIESLISRMNSVGAKGFELILNDIDNVISTDYLDRKLNKTYKIKTYISRYSLWGPYLNDLVQYVANPDIIQPSFSELDSVTIYDIVFKMTGNNGWANFDNNRNPGELQLPSVLALRHHKQSVEMLSAFMSRKRLSRADKARFDSFFANWKKNFEAIRYLKNDLSDDDIRVRIQELEERN